MKKYLLLLTSFAFLSSAIAAPGDTTTVVFQDAQELSWYEAYDEVNTLPDGTDSYNKIILEFVLGKYACDGYDPSNPGEGPNNTGWCADWDYDVHIQAINEDDLKVELGRLITPYANSNFPRTPAEWSQSYFFDVTDYYTFLKDEMTMRIFYAGWSGGFTGTIKLHFIEGPRHRDVLDYEVLYLDSYAFGDATKPINDSLQEKTVTVPASSEHGEVRVFITGHGADGSNCAEFCSKYYTMSIDGDEQQYTIWRDNCGSNFLYPQSGTWVWDRANWCPGDQVEPVIHSFTPGSSTTMPIRMQFQDYTASNTGASYKISATAFFFSDLHFTRDAGIEAIISPNLEDKFFRHNPSCGQSELRIKNYGSETIQSIKFTYKVNGNEGTYVWNGNIASLETQDIIIDLGDALSDLDINDEHTFEVSIDEINGDLDENDINNSAKSTFEATPKWDGGDYEITFKTSSAFSGQINRAYLKIYDQNDDVVFQMDNVINNNLMIENVGLPNGCYRLEISTPLGVGLRFFNYIMMNGSIDIKNLNTNLKVALPKNDFLGSLKGNFGNGFSQHFEIINSEYEEVVGVDELSANKAMIYPNPADDILNVRLDGDFNQTISYKVYNIIGQQLLEGTSNNNQFSISTQQLKSGNYFIEVQYNNHIETLKFNVK